VEMEAEPYIPCSRIKLRKELLQLLKDPGKKKEFDLFLHYLDLAFILKYNPLLRKLLDDFELFDPTKNPYDFEQNDKLQLQQAEIEFLTLVQYVLKMGNFKRLTPEEYQFAISEDYQNTLPITVKWEQFDQDLMKRYEEHVGTCKTTFELLEKADDDTKNCFRSMWIYHRGVGFDQTTDTFFGQKVDTLITIIFAWIWNHILRLISKSKNVPDELLIHKNVESPTNVIHRHTIYNCVNGLQSLMKKSTLQEPTFKEVVLLYRLKSPQIEQSNPNAIHIKTFRDIPMADLEILFPEKKVSLRPLDLILFTMTGCVGVVTAIINLGTDVSLLVTFASILSFAMLALKVVADYRTNMLYYESILLSSLFQKSVDTHNGVLLSLHERVKEQEIKEAAIALLFLSISNGNCSQKELDEMAENFLLELQGVAEKKKINFEVDDALNKLVDFGLVKKEERDGIVYYTALPTPQATEQLMQYVKSFDPSKQQIHFPEETQ